MQATNVVIYARYSSYGQNEQSIDQQFKVCEEYCERNGYTVIEHYADEAISGTTDKRPSFQNMIRDSYSQSFQYVIVYKLDRFSRDRYDSAHYKAILKKNGIKVLSACENIADDPTGIILEAMLEGMAEHYSANLSQNVKRGMDANAAQCLCTGGNRTLGYNIVDKKYVIDPLTAPTIKIIFEMYVKGQTAPEILKYLNAQHFKSVFGNDIKLNNVYSILKNKRYAGYYTYKTASLLNYNINGKNRLVYVSPREISNNQRTYNSKTYEYTHGYGLIYTSATSVTEDGNIEFIKNDNVASPRIYYGLETNNTIVTNNVEEEYDYTDSKGKEHTT